MSLGRGKQLQGPYGGERMVAQYAHDLLNLIYFVLEKYETKAACWGFIVGINPEVKFNMEGTWPYLDLDTTIKVAYECERMAEEMRDAMYIDKKEDPPSPNLDD
ncbi:hypothetical protein SAY87_004735 [Trapa incisa]|uniref:Uncharacterized protein n=1 Tax=Trapa incisa TaxID=236973 RepID=A0AAN7JUU7_9MYRT|nr:hypothetical protein SAY87_004735 [Trapa incisa]